jgi:PKD repeat protein
MKSSSFRSLLFLFPIAVALGFLATQVSAVGDPCIPPGLTILTDPTGDAALQGVKDPEAGRDVQSLSVAEPSSIGAGKLMFTLKVASLGSVPPDTYWPVQFKVGSTNYVARMSTVPPASPAAPQFQYYQGTYNSLVIPTSLFTADPSSTFNADGTIKIVVPRTGVGNPAVGSNLTEFLVRIAVFGGGLFLTPDNMPDSLTASGTYTVVGSENCGGVTATPTPTPSPTASPSGAGRPRFFSYAAPLGMAEASGEPSIGINWTTERLFSNSLFTTPNGGTSMYFGGFMTAALKVTFSDCSSPATVIWDQKALTTPNAPRVAGDPILFTDHDLGRTFVAQLLGLTPAGSTVDVTDNDGDSFLPSEGSSLPSDIDHETIGGGPAHAPLDTAFNALPYKHPIYYSSQSIAEAKATRSDDGGFTFGPSTLMYTAADCSGLHGHTKVAPDGTVYIPNNGCGGSDVVNHADGQQAVIVSEDNGITWSIRKVPGSTTKGDDDAAVGVSAANDPVTHKEVIYLGMQSADGHPRIAVSKDKGVTWSAPYDVGAAVVNGGPVVNCVFPEVVAGDPDRASFAFFGTEAAGAYASDGFAGVWYLYVATTFDGGQTWTTENITPGDPIQRGGVCGGGLCRNLLDFFDITIDKEGRIVIGGEDGCIANCVNHPPNSFTAKALISRQTGGKRLLSQYDPSEPALPGAPRVSGFFNPSTTANLSWPTPDHGGSPISGYNVYRSTGSGFALLANVLQNTFTDTASGPGVSYRVTAVNGKGEGPYCQDFAPAAAPPPKACVLPGILTITDILTGGQENDFGANQPPDPSVNVRQLFIGEPEAGKLVFTINVGVSPAGTPPPQSQWYIIWNKVTPIPNFDRNWVAMKTSQTGAITYEYGDFGVPLDPLNPNTNANMAVKVGDADSGSYNPATGEIRITVSNSKLENLQPGQTIAGIVVRTFLAKDPNQAKAVQTAADTTDPSHYDLVGTAPCLANTPPVAALTAAPTSGAAPLNVTFDATGSFDPDFGDTLVNYSFHFGDGTPDVSGGVPIVTHTYTSGGAFIATLVVTDSRGAASQNPAQQTITVTQSTASPTPSPTPTATATASPTPTATASPTPTATATASPTPTATATASPTPTSTATPTATASATPTATPTPTPVNVQLLNISGRVFAKTGDKIGIGGFIISGAGTKRIMARAIGTSLSVNGKLQDPYLELHDSNGSPPLTNDNWRSSQEAEIQQTGLAPTDDHESAIVKRLPAGTYTAILRGADGGQGVGVVELYDLSGTEPGELGNLSVRADVGTGDNVLFNGLILRGGNPKRVLFRALGPSVKVNGAPVPGSLQDPILELHDGNGALMATNDNWPDAPNAAEIQSTGLAPPDNHEPAILQSLQPGNYTTIVRGVGNTTGIGLAEAYKLSN